MKTRFDLTCWLALLLSCLALPTLRAAQFGPYTYSIYGEGNTTSITITGYDGMMAGVGPANVPASIEGVPVIAIGARAFSGNTNLRGISLPSSIKSIGDRAFDGNTGLTSLSLPASLTSIGNSTFSNCTGLTSLSLPASLTLIGNFTFFRCTGLTSLVLPNGLTSIGDFAFTGCTGLTRLSLPPSLTSIGHSAFSSCRRLISVSLPANLSSIGHQTFFQCTRLTSVSLPASLESIEDGAFKDCENLRAALFTGNALKSFNLDSPPFDPVFCTIYYLRGKTGFSSPIWNGYRAIMIDPATQPAATWLLDNGLRYNADLNTDTNQDGVSLLMAYALNLDPWQDLSGRLPQATMQGDTLGMTFYAASPGLTYRVEASADLIHWSTDGITQTALNRDGISTATVPRSGPAQFLRLAVSR